jgi:hypothetical protein
VQYKKVMKSKTLILITNDDGISAPGAFAVVVSRRLVNTGKNGAMFVNNCLLSEQLVRNRA